MTKKQKIKTIRQEHNEKSGNPRIEKRRKFTIQKIDTSALENEPYKKLIQVR